MLLTNYIISKKQKSYPNLPIVLQYYLSRVYISVFPWTPPPRDPTFAIGTSNFDFDYRYLKNENNVQNPCIDTLLQEECVPQQMSVR